MTMSDTLGGVRGATASSQLRALTIEQRNDLPVVDLGSTSVEIRCGEDLHHARVEGIRLELDAHSLEAELALHAFGAPLPACAVYALVWRDALASDAFFASWASDLDGEARRTIREDWLGNYWENWPTEPPAARALFGPRLQHALAVIAAGLPRAAGPAVVRRAMRVRARRAFVLSLAAVDAHRRPDALVPVTIAAVPDHTSAAVAGRLAQRGSSVVLRLPNRWLVDVWSRGRALLDGAFVLGADDAAATVDVVEWRPSGGPDGEHVPVVRARQLT